jgi:hypothetical protein
MACYCGPENIGVVAIIVLESELCNAKMQLSTGYFFPPGIARIPRKLVHR